ncbi:MAG TPA: ATP-binding protein [Nitrospirota bacterium]|nr:ATP-binding protein [Nitrospirota bacterium]
MRINLSLKLAVTITVVLLPAMGLMSWSLLKKHEQMATAQVEQQAKALFKQVVLTRRWVAEHGGVFIEKLPWVEANPYLRNSTITDMAGRRYVKENPAMVTKQLSRYAEREQLYIFHITSLKMLNPENAPDEFEMRALQDFEANRKTEASSIETIGPAVYYRYIAPLFVERSCLECHGKQGYTVGNVRGAISVSIPMDHVRSMIDAERRFLIAGMSVISLFLIAILFLAARRIVITPIKKIQDQMARFAGASAHDPVLIATGDEIEDLSRQFRTMARDIREYNDCLQQKIDAATHELAEQNEALVRSYHAKSDFIAKTSHELRTPLTSIKGAMDYLSVKLRQRGEGSDDVHIFFEMIKKNAERLIRLVNTILDFERINLGAFEMHFRDVNLRDVFHEVAAGFLPLATQKNVVINVDAAEVTACVDEDRIKQVLTNLLSNALNFSRESSHITVTLENLNGEVRAAVQDTGSGVPESEREVIFKQFYTRDVKDGTGLGLAICKGIVEAHGGSIGVETAEGGGSRFWFHIPASRKEQVHDGKETSCR